MTANLPRVSHALLTTHGSTQSLPTAPATNRLVLPGALYDAAGNLTKMTLGGESYSYVFDASNMMKSLASTNDQARVFVYNADDERILTFDCAGLGSSTCAGAPAQETWTLRGLGNEVLRVWTHPFGQPWRWEMDYIYRGGHLLSAVAPAGDGVGEVTSHFHLDHLGSPRQITGPGGTVISAHAYYPFGGEATDSAQDGFQLKFTGHERDENGGGKGMLDYMHAWHCSPELGRFASPDPIGGNPGSSQSWNRYAYVLNSPINFIDPLGLMPAGTFEDQITVYAYPSRFGRQGGAVSSRIFRWMGQGGGGGGGGGSTSAERSILASNLSFSQKVSLLDRGQPCRGANCQILRNVGQAAPFARALESGVLSALSVGAGAIPSGAYAVGAAPTIFRGGETRPFDLTGFERVTFSELVVATSILLLSPLGDALHACLKAWLPIL